MWVPPLLGVRLSSTYCFASSSRHTRCALVTGVQTYALPILGADIPRAPSDLALGRRERRRDRAMDAIFGVRRKTDLHEPRQGGDAVVRIGAPVGRAGLQDGVADGAVVGIGEYVETGRAHV